MKGYIDFSFKLPTCLYLVPGYEFPLEKERAMVKTEEIVETENSRMGRSTGMEISSDTDAVFRLTELHILIEDANINIPTERLKKVYEAKVLRITNRFIDAYRFVSSRHGIANISALDNMRGYCVTRDNTSAVSINFGSAGSALTPFKPLWSNEDHNVLAFRFEDWEMSLEDQFIMDARRYANLGHELQALISAVTSLDLVVQLYIRKKVSWFDGFFRCKPTALESIVRTTLKTTPVGKDLNIILRSIRERNQVVHGGKRALDGDVNLYIDAITNAIYEIKEVTAQAKTN